jgi:hypothetical protein
MVDDIIVGVNVPILLEQCETLAKPHRANMRSFQYASALDNCVAVINALRAQLTPEGYVKMPQSREEAQAMNLISERWLKDNPDLELAKAQAVNRAFAGGLKDEPPMTTFV